LECLSAEIHRRAEHQRDAPEHPRLRLALTGLKDPLDEGHGVSRAVNV
jgi:hypothetical protein